MTKFSRRWYRLEFLFLGAMIFACSDGGSGCDTGCDTGCGGCGDEGGGDGGPAYEFAGNVDEHVVHQGGQIHVTQRGLDTVATNVGPLIAGLIGDGGLTFCVPPTDVTIGDLCADSICEGEPGCPLSIELDNVEVIPERTDDPASDRIRVQLRLFMDESLGLDLGWLGSCGIGISSGADGVPVSANVYLAVDPPEWEQTHAQLPPDELQFSIDDIEINISGGVTCFIADLLVPLISGVFEDQLIGPLNDAIGPALCQTCEVTEDCPAGSSCDGDGICQFDGADACVPIDLGVEMEVAIGDLLADFAPGLEADLGILAYLANYADSFGPPGAGFDVEGIDLGLQLGFFAESNPCVPYFPPPDTARYPKSSAIAANETPAGAPFGVGIGISRSSLNLAGWAAYRSGALCLSIGSDTVEQLASSTFGILLPSLSDLTGGENRPLYLQLRPQRPPVIDLGAGTVTAEGEIDEPLLTLRLPELAIDFYVFTEDRYVRIMTLDTDVEVPLALDVNDANQIVILLGDLTNAITRIDASNDELLADGDSATVAVLLPSLLGSLLPTLLGDGLAPIDIPELLEGVTIAIPPGGFTSVDDNQMLAIYADIAIGAAGKSGSLQPMVAGEEIVRTSPTEVATMLESVRAGTEQLNLEALIPTVQLSMSTVDPAGLAREFDYSYRINNGVWSFWQSGDEVEIHDSIMALSGTYNIDVRVRESGDSRTASSNLAVTAVTTDYVPPSVELSSDADYTLSTIDMHSAIASARYRVDAGSWVAFEGSVELELGVYSGRDVVVEAIAIDEFGNTTQKSFEVNVPGAAPTASESVGAPVATPGQAGCASSRNGSAPFALAFGLLGLVLTRRRGLPRTAALGVLALALVACGGGETNTGTTDCEPACEDGLTCSDGECIAEGACEDDSQCEGDLVCIAEACVEAPCECGEGQECDEAGECVDIETPCEANDDCGDLQICDDGTCADVECFEDTDCACDAGNAVCTDNVCDCEPACGGGCEDGFGCCIASDECVEIDVECGEGACDVGFGLAASGDPQWDSSTCEATVECECEELPPLEAGYIGEYLDIGVSPDKSMAAVAAYNSTYGDLMVGVIGSDSVAWSYVAGVPDDGEIEGSLNGPRGGNSEPGDDVGQYPSIAFDADGNAHVAFYARTGDGARSLNYARGASDGGEFTWTFAVLDDTNLAGHYTDIEIAPTGEPVIAYAVPSIRDAELGTFESQIRVVRADSAAAATWSEPSVLTRAFLTEPCGNSCVGSQECRLDTNACSRSERSSACDPECADGTSCFENEDGTKVCSATAPPVEGIPVLYNGIGIFLDAEFIGDRYAVAHYDHTVGNLVYASTDAVTLAETSSVIVDGEVLPEGEAEPVDTGDVGWYPDLAVGSDGGPIISYMDATMGSLRVADIGAGVILPVDDGVRCYEPDPESGECLQPLRLLVGYDSAIAGDESGMHVVYQDATWQEVLESPRTEFGWDLPGTVATGGDPYTGAYGFYLAHGSDAEGRFVISYRLNQRAEPATRDVVVIRR